MLSFTQIYFSMFWYWIHPGICITLRPYCGISQSVSVMSFLKACWPQMGTIWLTEHGPFTNNYNVYNQYSVRFHQTLSAMTWSAKMYSICLIASGTSKKIHVTLIITVPAVCNFSYIWDSCHPLSLPRHCNLLENQTSPDWINGNRACSEL